ncbi:hypothetical protein J6P52_05440 [bacterium]|nr:hypothetical protein [bacterium]
MTFNKALPLLVTSYHATLSPVFNPVTCKVILVEPRVISSTGTLFQ